MWSDNLRISALSAGELVIVLIGIVNIPAAIALQILIPFVIFRDRILDRPIKFIAVYTLGTIIFIAILVSFRHTLLPLTALGSFAILVLFTLIISEAYLQRRYGGVV